MRGQANSHLLDSLLELQALDRLPRVGFSLRGVAAPESISEHLFHLTFLVWTVGRASPEIDLGKALEIALLHDLAEVRLGDLPRTAAAYQPEGVKAAAEREILEDVLAPLPGCAAILAEYQQRGSREAQLVAVCDKVQLLVKAYVYREIGNRAMDEFFDRLDGFDDGGFPRLGELVAELGRRLRSTEP